jgi:type VI secretion system protein ImpH
MAADAGSTGLTLGAALAERPYDFHFLQAMWLIGRALPDSVPVGHQGPPDRESVRLTPSVSLAFPARDIESAEENPETTPPYHLYTTFLGLYGAHSPLPSYYSEEILHQSDEGEDPVRGFLDIFNHRLLSLLYRGLLKFRGHLLFGQTAEDEFSWRLFALSGLSASGLAEASGLPKVRLLEFAGLWCQLPRSAAALEAMVRTYLALPCVGIQQNVPRWVYLDPSARCRLGVQANRLGQDAIAGRRIPDHVGKFRVSVGPLEYDTYCEYLPGTEKAKDLARLARLGSGGWLAFDMEIILRGEDTPRLAVVLSSEGKLGLTAGLFSRPAEDLGVVFRPERAAA